MHPILCSSIRIVHEAVVVCNKKFKIRCKWTRLHLYTAIVFNEYFRISVAHNKNCRVEFFSVYLQRISQYSLVFTKRVYCKWFASNYHPSGIVAGAWKGRWFSSTLYSSLYNADLSYHVIYSHKHSYADEMCN